MQLLYDSFHKSPNLQSCDYFTVQKLSAKQPTLIVTSWDIISEHTVQQENETVFGEKDTRMVIIVLEISNQGTSMFHFDWQCSFLPKILSVVIKWNVIGTWQPYSSGNANNNNILRKQYFEVHLSQDSFCIVLCNFSLREFCLQKKKSGTESILKLIGNRWNL